MVKTDEVADSELRSGAGQTLRPIGGSILRYIAEQKSAVAPLPPVLAPNIEATAPHFLVAFDRGGKTRGSFEL